MCSPVRSSPEAERRSGSALSSLAGALSVAGNTVVGLTSFVDAGYPDSATLLRVAEFVRSGHLYPAVDRPPYLVTLYGPLTYVLLAIPYAVAQAVGLDPVMPVRIVILAAMFACLVFVYQLARRLQGSRAIGWLCVLFAMSATPLAIIPVRGDLLAALFSLMSLQVFLLGNRRFQIAGTVICAAAAVLVKQTFVAAPVAITCWLIYKRRYKDAAFMVAGFVTVVAAAYAFFLLRDPLALEHIAALRRPVFDYPGALVIARQMLSQPAVPFAALGGLVVLWRRDTNSLPLLVYCLVAWLVAIATIPQVGGGTNYFWEPLLASAVLAGPGLCELQRQLKRAPLLVAAVFYVLLLNALLPMVRQDVVQLRGYYRSSLTYEVRKARWQSFAATVSGRRLLSTMPDVAVRSNIPEIPDPFLNSVLESRGMWDSGPVVAKIENGTYDLIVISTGEADNPGPGYRGVHGWSDAMWSALKRAYRPACNYDGKEVWLPSGGSPEIGPRLLAIGCMPVPARTGADGGGGRV